MRWAMTSYGRNGGKMAKEKTSGIYFKVTDGEQDILLATREGQCIRFHEKDVRSMGRIAMGVRGINLGREDEVVGMQMSSQGDNLLLVSEHGMGKRTNINEFSPQFRGGKGVKCYKITPKTGQVVAAKIVEDGSDIMLITNEGIIIRTGVDGISILGRVTSGVKLMNLDEEKDIRIASIARVWEDDSEDEDD